MSESIQPFDPAEALRTATATRTSTARSITYPRGYVAASALASALLIVGASTAAPDVPQAWLRLLFAAAAPVGVVLAVMSLRSFEHHNRARITGLRFARRGAVVYLAAFLMLAVGVAVATATGATWWTGLVAAPIAALLTAGYLRYWLAAYRREQS